MDEESYFFDVETGERPGRFELAVHGAEFRLLRRFGYKDRAHEEAFVVPLDPATFTTDLASVPKLFAWLVPGLGTHLPAVLLHDALVLNDDERRRGVRHHIGPTVDRLEADRILRDGMAGLGTPLLLRWIMWVGVVLATAWTDLRPSAWWRLLTVVTFGTVVVLGVLATLDVVDAVDVLPWMGDRPWWVELAGGAAFAVVIPLALALLWGRLRPAAAIGGIALAFLLHVTVAVAAVYAVYWVLESLVSRAEGGASARENVERVAADATSPAEPLAAP